MMTRTWYRISRQVLGEVGGKKDDGPVRPNVGLGAGINMMTQEPALWETDEEISEGDYEDETAGLWDYVG